MTDRALGILLLVAFVCILAGQRIPTLIALAAITVVVVVEVVVREPVSATAARAFGLDEGDA